ncbi:ubiquitin [Mitosporidium daphniae]|uniref:Ubiquitin n=1 Tax=Mitosporidium daphniae TaxID=1485682 RepID=A0A098VSF9_9MICR|nr:ubiquitin [Mitosporidium daphniae]KGG50681.1 ubiquitin [Mitosporidium daphniae]|eukprot:XP_013237108.1 ubiquitin [Mitosporidium daphniae]
MTVTNLQSIDTTSASASLDTSARPSDQDKPITGPNSSTKKSARRCPVDGCQSKPAPIVGECRYCSSKFCSTHRLPESHMCTGLSACKTSSRMLLSERLLNEKCVAEKL